jgi:hypothetical protein
MTHFEKWWVGTAIVILYIATVIGFTVLISTQDDLDAEVRNRLGQISVIARDRCQQVNDVAIAVKQAIAIATINSDESPLRKDLVKLREFGEQIKLRDCQHLPGVDPGS